MSEMSSQEYLTFIADKEEFGVSILAVQEIRVWTAVTDMPNTPSFVKGIINLRGVIVPIVDLRERLNKPPTEYNENTVVIVLKGRANEKEVVVGIVVDAVSDVYKFSDKDIKSAPDFGKEIDSQFVLGMAMVKEKIIIVLDENKLLNVEELYQLSDDLNKLAS
ncbi:MAG: chemotaxis protein CheW [Cellvibrionaceae bacterium]|nr:chemotaxis protein CheW [Cellvibrionaceae bacterium]